MDDISKEIMELKALGPLPSEDDADPIFLKKIDELIKAIVKPVSDQEARILVGLFGVDGCFGLASALMHIIETSPGWPLKDVLANLDNEWKILLKERAVRGGRL